jgi:hypothetical protein
LSQAGAALNNMVHTPIYLTDIFRWREVATIYFEVLGRSVPGPPWSRWPHSPSPLVEIEARDKLVYVTR